MEVAPASGTTAAAIPGAGQLGQSSESPCVDANRWSWNLWLRWSRMICSPGRGCSQPVEHLLAL
eukprot:2503089-Pyramimonas_sp.AAC.1